MGNTFFSQAEWDRLIEHLNLPARQAQILDLIIDERSDAEIAIELGIAEPTVRTHVVRLMERFSVDTRIGLVLYIMRAFREIEGL